MHEDANQINRSTTTRKQRALEVSWRRLAGLLTLSARSRRSVSLHIASSVLQRRLVYVEPLVMTRRLQPADNDQCEQPTCGVVDQHLHVDEKLNITPKAACVRGSTCDDQMVAAGKKKDASLPSLPALKNIANMWYLSKM